MIEEYGALVRNNTWTSMPHPPQVNVVRSMWLFRHKLNSDGTLERYKARMVVNDNSQQVGVDCCEMFSLIVKLAMIQTILSLVFSRSWPILQLDVKIAIFLGTFKKLFA